MAKQFKLTSVLSAIAAIALLATVILMLSAVSRSYEYREQPSPALVGSTVLVSDPSVAPFLRVQVEDGDEIPDEWTCSPQVRKGLRSCYVPIESDGRRLEDIERDVEVLAAKVEAGSPSVQEQRVNVSIEAAPDDGSGGIQWAAWAANAVALATLGITVIVQRRQLNAALRAVRQSIADG